MSISLTTTQPLLSNGATFENDSVSGQDQGDITWGSISQEGSNYYVTFEGTDVQGGSINPTTVSTSDSGETVNPTKVFWWIVRTAKAVLCPECV